MRNGLIIDNEGNKYYYENDKFHRLGGLPACEYTNGAKFYYENGQRHRLDGLPAIEYANGDKCYCENGKLHRLDGPAIEDDCGDKEWWINGEKLDVTTQKEFKKLMKLKAFW